MSETRILPVLVIGVSGATWDVLMPLIRNSKAPNIGRLLDRGCGAPLTSIKAAGDEHYRPQVAWASVATGRIPDRHGVTRFFHEADQLREPTLWDIYNELGLPSGIYGWPGTWPPRPIHGFVVPSHLARDTRTWPPSLGAIKAIDREQQAQERGGGGIVERVFTAGSHVRTLFKLGLRLRTLAGLISIAPTILFGSVEHRRLVLRRAKLEASADFFIQLHKLYRPSLSAFVTFHVDFVSHRYWRYRDPQLFHTAESRTHKRYFNAVDDAYVRLDKVVGRLLTTVGENAIVLLVSEHGMDPEPISTEVGPWYFSIRGPQVRDLAGLDEKLGPYPVARWCVFRPVDSESSALVANRLRQIQVIETGLPLFRVYEHGDEVVIKLALDADVPRYAKGELESLTVRIGDKTAPFTEVAKQFGRQRSAMHAANGIFIMAGPNIRRGVWLPNASVLDVAPTLVRAAGIPCKIVFDGATLEVFSS